tara:strand:+ start:282 stop:602 length:321 start_codon:yes stop_codon:yes gene_type:complete
MSKEKDHVADIMNKWYDAMEKNKVMVQPKASTLLGTILAGYNINPCDTKRDIWAEALTKRGGEFMDWYKSLTEQEQAIYHDKLTCTQAHKRDHVDPEIMKKKLLKG